MHEKMTNNGYTFGKPLEAQAALDEVRRSLTIIKVALLEVANPIQGEPLDAEKVAWGAVEALRECEPKMDGVSAFLSACDLAC